MVYDIHVFTLVRVKVEGIEANTMPEAIERARASVDFMSLLSHSKYNWAEEHSHYLVDLQGSSDYSESRWYTDKEHRYLLTHSGPDDDV
jgi:two-component SAPR family response regulator